MNLTQNDRLLKLKEAGDKNGVALPKQEETRLATNFIR